MLLEAFIWGMASSKTAQVRKAKTMPTPLLALQVWALALSESRLISASLDSTIYVRSFRPADQACRYGGVRGEDSAGGGSDGDDSNSDSGSESGSSAAELDSAFASSDSSDAGSESGDSEGWSEDSEGAVAAQ